VAFSDRLAGVWRALMRLPSTEGGRSVLFVSARSGEGTSDVAAAFCEHVAGRAQRPIMLYDLDLAANPQFEAYRSDPRGLKIGPGLDMTFGATPFWRIAGRPDAPQLAAIYRAHRLEPSRLFVTRFAYDDLRPGDRVEVVSAPDYWAVVRQRVEIAVLDAPSLERSRAALALARDVDAVVLVVEADARSPAEAIAAREAIEARGANVIGVVLSRAPRTLGWSD
jgi:hypothetical protein